MNTFHQQPEHLSEEQRCAAALLRLAQGPPTLEHYSKKPSLPDASLCTSAVLNEALSKVTTAIAHLHRAGQAFKRRSEAYWIFMAGTWSRTKFEEQVSEAQKKLLKALSAAEDVMMARGLVDEAIAMLTKGDIRDARDLEVAKRAFERGTLW